MKTALLYFAIWLIGTLISAYVIFKALRADCTTSLYDYFICIFASLLSWVFLISVVVLYLVDRSKALGKRMETMWKRIDEWWRSR